MATLTIDSLDDGVYERLRDRARTNNRTVEAEAREVLAAQVEGESEIDRDRIQAWAARLSALREKIAAKHGMQTDSVALIRAIRDEE
jgi:plasmid stability protein